MDKSLMVVVFGIDPNGEKLYMGKDARWTSKPERAHRVEENTAICAIRAFRAAGSKAGWRNWGYRTV